jgi:hypothetical protein
MCAGDGMSILDRKLVFKITHFRLSQFITKNCHLEIRLAFKRLSPRDDCHLQESTLIVRATSAAAQPKLAFSDEI